MCTSLPRCEFRLVHLGRHPLDVGTKPRHGRFGCSLPTNCPEPSSQESNGLKITQPVSSAWRLGAGGEKQASESFKWGFTTELLYGGNIDVDKRSTLPPVLGGRGNLVGSYDQTLSVVLTVYGNWAL